MSALAAIDSGALAEAMTDDDAVKLALSLLELAKEDERQRWQNLFPNDGPLRRELYPKHMEFFKAGATHRERLFMAANRVGKTVGIGFEVKCHLTGRYPDWWEGRVFDRPIDAWAAGDTNETTRDIIQKTLFGNVVFDGAKKTFDGCGVIPYDAIGQCRFKPNTGDLLDYAEVKHETGRWSRIGLKSYEQGRKVFQGTAKDLIWSDEEPPVDVYGECLIRTTTTNGIMLVGFTPLLGMSEVVLSFLQPGEEANA